MILNPSAAVLGLKKLLVCERLPAMENKTLSVYDSAHDLLSLKTSNLAGFFNPKRVALIGATDRPQSVGRSTFENLLRAGFQGEIFAVNPQHSEVLGKKAYPTLRDIPDSLDLAIITTPAKTVPGLIQECAELKIPCAIIISAGFKEVGPEGVRLEQEVLKIAQNKVRIIGPNCLGLMSPWVGLNATFAQAMARPGKVAFLSQSGAMCTAILDWSLSENFGFSGFVSMGSMADVGWGDLIEYFGSDPNTTSLVLYMETIGDARSFVSAARKVALSKPIVVIKAGRTQAAAKAAASHTGSLTGSDDVLDAAFERCGVLRVDSMAEIFYSAEILAQSPLPQGRRLSIVTNAGGPGVLATDALLLGGGELAKLSPETLQKLNSFLPAAWSHSNPIDILGDATAERYKKTLLEVLQSSDTDAVLVITTPQGVTDPLEIATELVESARTSGKPVLTSWMGGGTMQSSEKIFAQGKIPNFPFPDQAVRGFNLMWRSREVLKNLYETPRADVTLGLSQYEKARKLLAAVQAQGRSLLSEYESKNFLQIYDIPTVQTLLANTSEQAVAGAETLGYPVVLKVHSETITHKSDVGGVLLNLKTSAEVEKAFHLIQNRVNPTDFLGVTVQTMFSTNGYELILGASTDPQFGPVLLFGTGGKLVEVFKDRALALPPLTTSLARRWIEKTKISTALRGVRGQGPVNAEALEKLLVRFSELVLNHPEILEIDINPLLASEKGLVALDARIVICKMDSTDAVVKPAIRPYPVQYETELKLRDGTLFQFRPLRPEDELRLIEFHRSLSTQSVYSRYLQNFSLSERTQHERLVRLCHVDYDRELAFVALTKTDQIAGLVRVRKQDLLGELTLMVRDSFQNQGLGFALIHQLILVSHQEGLNALKAWIAPNNLAMKTLLEKLNFKIIESKERLLFEIRLKN